MAQHSILFVLIVVYKCLYASIPTLKLQNSASPDSYLPWVGLGCAIPVPADQQFAVGYSQATQWLSAGGRLFDEAHCYGSREGVAAAVLNFTENWTKIKRSEIIIMSKVGGCSGNNLGFNEAMDWFNDILTLWKTTYIDVLMLHWPAYDSYPVYSQQLSLDPTCFAYENGTFGPQYNATQCRLHSWKALITLYLNGSAKAIGVSNYEVKHLMDLENYKFEGDGKVYLPALNQMQFHGYWHEYDLLNYCIKKKIQYNSWSALGAPDVTASVWNGTTPVLTKHPIAMNIGKKYGKSAAQVWLRWNLQLNVLPIPRSNNISHMRENMDIFDFKLSADDMDQLYNITAPPYFLNLVYTPTTQQDPNNLP